MCVSPIKIRNNSRSFQHGVSPLFREVPCGHCLECQQSVQMDWFVRLAYEWFDCIDNKKGTCFLITFTYNDFSRPYFNVDKHVCDVLNYGLKRLVKEDDEVSQRRFDFEQKYGISFDEYIPFSHYHFDRQDLSKFLKSLRQILDYFGVYKYEENDTIKYFIASEYGHESHLPHYHGIFFLPFKISAERFMQYCRYAWSFGVKRCDLPDFAIRHLNEVKNNGNGFYVYDTEGTAWHDWFYKKVGRNVYVKKLRGFLSYSKKWPAELTSVSGIEYVSKYVSKKDDYLLHRDWLMLSDYLHIFPRRLIDIESRYPDLVKYVRILRSYFPKVHTSNGLGISILNEFDMLSEDDIAKMCVSSSLSVKGIARKFNVPAYILNRVMYDNDDCDFTLRKLSSVGVKVLRAKLIKTVDEFPDKYQHNINEACHLLTSNEINDLQEEFHIGLFSCPDLRQLSIYNTFFRYVEIPDKNVVFDDIHSVIDTFFYDYFDSMLSPKYDVSLPPNLMHPSAVRVASRYCWNYQPCFHGFDNYLDYYNSICLLVRKRKMERKKQEYLESQRYRKLYNEPLYNFNY